MSRWDGLSEGDAVGEHADALVSGDHARLIPVAADTSKEVRTVSVLLAALAHVPPFARTMLGPLGQRLGKRTRIECFTEVVLSKNGPQAQLRPDGLLVVDGGRGRTWRCLIEAKVGRSEIDPEQITKYLALAKSTGIDAVLTVSNQFVATPTHSPARLPRNATKGVELYHWSWMSVLTHASLLINEHEFERPEQKVILGEVVRYLSHQSTGVNAFDRMNPEWKELNTKIQAGARLSKSAPEVENSVAAWHQEARDICLLMSRKLNRTVRLKLSRSHTDDQAQRLKDDSADLVANHQLSCVLDVPDAAAPINVTADLQRRCVAVSMSLAAPRDKKRASSRINWLVRQLSKSEPDGLHIRATWPGRAPDTQASLEEVRSDPALLEAENKSLSPTQFEIVLIRDLAGKFSGSRTFVELLEQAVPYFYEQVGEHVRAYVAPPPKLHRSAAPADVDDAASQTTADAVD